MSFKAADGRKLTYRKLGHGPVVVCHPGGPGFSSTTLVMYIYNEAFSYDNMGYAAAIAMMLMLLILILAVVQLTLFRKDVEF